VRRNPRQLLDPKDARGSGVDRSGTLWVDGNAKGVKTNPATEAYRKGWDRVFAKVAKQRSVSR
jgi:hypothetical protein